MRIRPQGVCVTPHVVGLWYLTHWGQVTHTCVSELIIICSDKGLSPVRQAIFSTNVGILLVGPLGTNFSEIVIEILKFSLKMHLNVSSAKCRPFSLCINVSTHEELPYCTRTPPFSTTPSCQQDIMQIHENQFGRKCILNKHFELLCIRLNKCRLPCSQDDHLQTAMDQSGVEASIFHEI